MSGEYLTSQFTVPVNTTISATNSGGGPTSVSLSAGTYYVDTLCAHLQTQLTAARPPSSGAWSVTWSPATGRVTMNCTGTWSLTWTSGNLRDVLGFSGNITSVSTAQTGAYQAIGVWFPQCPLTVEGDPMTAPRVETSRTSISPTGDVFKVVGPISYLMRNVLFSHVPQAQVWAAHSTLINADYETWYLTTQAGSGHPWFKPASPTKVYWNNAGALAELGLGAVTAWKFPAPQTLAELALAEKPWTGYVTVVLGDARSTG